MRRTMLTIAVLCELTLTGAAQQPSAARFEVASIKLWQPPTTSAPGIYRRVPAPPGSGIFNRTTTLAGLIAEAYEVQDFQLSGGEDWVRTERYDVAAQAGREVSAAELGEMVKALVRTETRELPILELRLARSDGQVGSNLHNCSKESVPEAPFRAPTGGTVAVSDCSGDGGSRLAAMASRQLKILVVDKTGLTGQWWYAVFYGREPLPAVALSQETVNPDLPSFEGALREQLGLRLERTRGPVPFIVIESADRPTPN